MVFNCGENRGTQRKPMQTQGEHINSTKEGPSQPGIEARTFLLCKPLCHRAALLPFARALAWQEEIQLPQATLIGQYPGSWKPCTNIILRYHLEPLKKSYTNYLWKMSILNHHVQIFLILLNWPGNLCKHITHGRKSVSSGSEFSKPCNF